MRLSTIIRIIFKFFYYFIIFIANLDPALETFLGVTVRDVDPAWPSRRYLSWRRVHGVSVCFSRRWAKQVSAEEGFEDIYLCLVDHQVSVLPRRDFASLRIALRHRQHSASRNHPGRPRGSGSVRGLSPEPSAHSAREG